MAYLTWLSKVDNSSRDFEISQAGGDCGSFGARSEMNTMVRGYVNTISGKSLAMCLAI